MCCTPAVLPSQTAPQGNEYAVAAKSILRSSVRTISLEVSLNTDRAEFEARVAMAKSKNHTGEDLQGISQPPLCGQPPGHKPAADMLIVNLNTSCCLLQQHTAAHCSSSRLPNARSPWQHTAPMWQRTDQHHIPHSTQPELQSAQKRHQEAQEAALQLHPRHGPRALADITNASRHCCSPCCPSSQKFLRNQRHAKKGQLKAKQ